MVTQIFRKRINPPSFEETGTHLKVPRLGACQKIDFSKNARTLYYKNRAQT